jgi:CheY-like chemotaxis protein
MRTRISIVSIPRIFVVDDEEVISTTRAAILQRSGFHVSSFTNPLEALAATFSERPNLLISDIVMPQISGIELAVQIKQICRDCEILLVSGDVGTADLVLDSKAQGNNFDLLAKPVHPSVLIQAARLKLMRCGAIT